MNILDPVVAASPTGLPSYVSPSLTGKYDPQLNLYNAKPGNTRQLVAGRARAKKGLGACEVFIGDSLTAACTVTSPLTFDNLHAWPRMYADALAESGVPDSGTGIVRALDGIVGHIDPRWTYSGFWGNATTYTFTASPGLNTVFTSDKAGSTVAVIHLKGTASGGFTVSVDGATSGAGFATVTPATGTLGWVRYELPGLAVQPGSTISITSNSSNIMGLYGIEVFTPGGMAYHNLGCSSSTAAGSGTTSWSDATDANQQLFVARSSAIYSQTPTAVHIALGVNDLNAGTAVATVIAAISTIRAQFPTSDVILYAASQFSTVTLSAWQAYVAALYNLANTLDCPLRDLHHRYGGYTAMNAIGFAGDAYGHMTSQGYADWGSIAAGVAPTGGTAPYLYAKRPSVGAADARTTVTLQPNIINQADATAANLTRKLAAGVTAGDQITVRVAAWASPHTVTVQPDTGVTGPTVTLSALDQSITLTWTGTAWVRFGQIGDYAPLSTRITVMVDDHGLKGDWTGGTSGSGTNDTTALQALMDALPEHSTLRFTSGKTYRLDHLTSTKSFEIDGNGASLVVKPTGPGVRSGSPVFWFKGAVAAKLFTNTIAAGASTLTMSTSGDAASFAAGDYVVVGDAYLWPTWDGTPNAGGPRQQITLVSSVDTGAGTVTIDGAAEFAYDTSPYIRKITTLLTQPHIHDFRSIVEIDPGAAYTAGDGPIVGACPHIFHFQYAKKPLVERCHFSQWQMHAVNFHQCLAPELRKSTGVNPYRPNSAGNGYFMRFDSCNGGLNDANWSRGVRHHTDWVQSYDCVSSNNVAVGCIVAAYETHGIGAKRSISVNDTVDGQASTGTGWYHGNPSFNADYDFTIISPHYQGNGTGIITTTNSQNCRVINPDIHTTFRGVIMSNGATGLLITDGTIEIIGTASGAFSLLARQKTGSGDPAGVSPGDLTMIGTRLMGNAPVSVDNAGVLHLSDLDWNATATASSTTLLLCGWNDNVIPAALVWDNLRMRGSFAQGVNLRSAPAGQYDVHRVHVEGHTVGGVAIPAATNLRLTSSHVPAGLLPLVVSGDTTAAKAGGAIFANNNPSTYDSAASITTAQATVGDPATATTTELSLKAAAGTARQIAFYAGSALRWLIRANNTAESGGDTGSVLEINARHDDGSNAGTLLSLSRLGVMGLNDGLNIDLGGTTGTTLARTTAQKLGFHGTSATVQVPNTVDPATALATKGLVASGPAKAGPIPRRLKSGQYQPCADTTSLGTSNNLGNGNMRVHSMQIADTTAFVRMVMEITSAGSAGGVLRFVVYADDGTGYPGALLFDSGVSGSASTVLGNGLIDGTNVSVQEATCSVPVSYGLVWVGCVLQGAPATQPTVRSLSAAVGVGGGSTTLPTAGAAFFGYVQSGVTGAAPATFTATPSGSSNVARLWVKT